MKMLFKILLLLILSYPMTSCGEAPPLGYLFLAVVNNSNDTIMVEIIDLKTNNIGYNVGKCTFPNHFGEIMQPKERQKYLKSSTEFKINIYRYKAGALLDSRIFSCGYFAKLDWVLYYPFELNENLPLK